MNMQENKNRSNETATKHPLWWELNMTSMQYSCSEQLLKMCGLEVKSLSHDEFLMLINPHHKNRIKGQMQAFLEGKTFDEKFELLTKFGYRWVNSRITDTCNSEFGEYIIYGHIDFMNETDTLAAQYNDAQTRLSELMGIYVSFSKTLTELLDPALDTQTLIYKILHDLLIEFKSERAYIFEYDMENLTQSCIHEMLSSNIESTQTSLQQIPINETPWWTQTLLKDGCPIVYDDIHDLPIEAYNEYKILADQSIKSIMVVPLINKSGVSGYLGIETVSHTHSWRDVDKLWFESLANMISLCIELKKSEEIAQIDKSHYKQLYLNMPIGFIQMKVIYDDKGDIVDYIYTDINTAAINMFPQIPTDKIIGKSALDLGVAISPKHIADINRVVNTKEIQRASGEHASGKYFDYILYSVKKDEMVALIQDNTETVTTSKALRKSKETLAKIYENIPVGIEIYDKDGYLIDINDIEQKTFGYPDKASVLGLNLFDNPNIPKLFLDDLRNNKPSWCDFHYNFEKIDNYYNSSMRGDKHIILKGVILYDIDHQVENYILIVLDNTDTLKANHKIHEFEILFNSIAEFSEIGLSQWNPCQNTLFGTDQWYHNICHTTDKVNDIRSAYTSIVEEDRKRLYEHFDNMVAGKINNFREEIRVCDGKKIKWLKTNYKVVEYSPQTNNIEIIGINIDITELKNTETKLIEAKQKAEQSDKLKSAFLANMSHEIRTPLNAITGFSDLLISAESDEEKEQYIKTIRHNNDLLLQLISDILDLSKIESGVIEIKTEPVNINDVCSEVTFTQSNKIQNNIKLTFDNQGQDECVIDSDRNRLSQILINLVSNAIKFTKKGSINVGYKVSNDEVMFYVKDSGVGISPEQQEAIFDRFVKLNSFSTGTGLGLSICKNMVERMGGKLWVESTENDGSTFFFTLPRETKKQQHEATQAADKSDIKTENNKMESPHQTTTKGKPLILVAEDTDSNYLLISMILKKEYELIRAKDGLEAIELFAKHKPQLVLMDIKMPNMNGLEATQKIRETDQTTPIFAITAFAYNNDRIKALEAGCTEFLTKPVHQVELKETIARYIG